MGFEFQEHSSRFHVPFRALDKKLLVDPEKTFSSTEDVALFFNLKNVTRDLWSEGKVEVILNGLSDKNSPEKSLSIDLRNYPYNETLCVFHSIPSQELTPDYYKMKLILKDEKQAVIDEKVSHFIISPKENVPHPVTLAKSFPLSNSFLYFYSLAYQYDKANKPEKAEAAYKKAHSIKPEFKEGLVEYAWFLLKTKKFRKSLELIDAIKEDEKLKLDYYLIKGKAYMGMGNYQDAIHNLLEGNKIYDSDVSLLNSLGLSYYKTNQKKKALDVFKASLSLNPEQKDIKRLIKEIEN